MSFFTSWPMERYPVDLPLRVVDRFDFATAQVLMWAAQLAYESGEHDKVRVVLDRWRWTLNALLFAPLTSRLPLLSVEGFVATRDNACVLALPGTEPTSLPEWIRNLRVHPDERGIHEGFAAAADAVLPDVIAMLAPGGAAADRPLYISGHSLGGAVAVVLAERLVAKGVLTAERIAGVYTFGMPRAGNAAFAETYRQRGLDDRTFRFVYGVDLVPQVPPPDGLFNYRHVGSVMSCERGAFFEGAPLRDDRSLPGIVLKAVDTLFGTLAGIPFATSVDFPGNPFAGAVINHLPPPLRDHVPDRYLRALRALENFPKRGQT